MIVGGEMLCETFANFPGKVQAGEGGIFLLQFLDDAQAVLIVFKSAVALHQFSEHGFALVPKRRMAEVVGERNRFRQIGVQPERTGDVAGNGGDLHRVCEPRAKMIARAV